MIYINVTEDNEFTLNVNNNVRDPFPNGEVDMVFKHILSDRSETYTGIKIDPPAGDPSTTTFFGSHNGRYTEFWVKDTIIASLCAYDGEYQVVMTNDEVVLYRGIWKITGNSEVEENPFIEYQSDNENNDSYIYIEE